MGANGSIIADFGPFPGQSDVVVAVTGQAGIVAGSEVEAWVEPIATAAGYTADGYPFDGTRRLERATLVGVADSTQGMCSLWFRDVQTLVGSSQPFFGTFFTGFADVLLIGIDSASTILVSAFTSGAVQIFSLSAPAYKAGWSFTDWNHLLASWDIAANAGSMWLNDVNIGTFTRSLNQAVPYSTATDATVVARDENAIVLPRGKLGELYFAAGQYLDFTVQANRRKFNQVIGDGALRPIDLGATGSGPTGAQPSVYLRLDHGADPATFLTNKGSGGNFSRAAGSAPGVGTSAPLCLYPGHSPDEHVLESLYAMADKSSIVAGTGFNIRVYNTQPRGEPQDRVGAGGAANRLSGKYNVGWAWN